MNTLIVTPMRREARAIGATAVSIGAGAASADALRRLLSQGDAAAVIIAGICGALDPSLAPGDIVMASSVAAAGKPEIFADARMLDAAQSALDARKPAPTRDSPMRVRATCGRILTVASPSLDPDGRAKRHRDDAAVAVDMETHPLAVAATDCRVPWIAVRTVSDAANARLPRAISSWQDEHDDWRVARGIALRPQDWLAAARLVRDTGLALRSLSLAVAAITAALEGIAPSAADA